MTYKDIIVLFYPTIILRQANMASNTSPKTAVGRALQTPSMLSLPHVSTQY